MSQLLHFQVTTSYVHEYSSRCANELHISFGRLDIRNFSIRIHGAKVGNALPNFVKQSRSLGIFKNTLPKSDYTL